MQFIRPTPAFHDVRALRELAREIVAGLLERAADELPTDVALRELGVDSRIAVALIAALTARLGRPLPETLIYAYPTLEALARALAEGDHVEPELPLDLPADEPIAVVGIGCRFPGGANDPEKFFASLRGCVDAVGPCPEPRRALLAQDHPSLRGGFLEDVASFDEAFFGISPREASEMDPQQRLMLEVSWEALEDAGIAPSGLSGTRTSVFVGAMWQDYAHHTAALAHDIEQHTATGIDTSVIAARISYRLGLRGPSMTVNTACSSALVAVHLACQSLRQRESKLALAGGVNLILAPHSTIAMARFGALSPDQRCKAFDAAADGYVRGEGAGVLVLKRLAEAVTDGDPIYCVIRGSAVNNDGASNGLTAPSQAAQAQVLREAYARARVAPKDVQYVEAHGTGTRLGDPIEAGALGEVLGRGRSREHALRIGSVKTNIGHLEAAAGIASLIKVALALRHRYLPPTLHLSRPNPAIDFEGLGIAPQREGGAFPHPDGALYAGVSAFGFGGTNAHVVLEGAYKAEHQLLTVAADDAHALRQRAARLAQAAQHVDTRDGLRALCETSRAFWHEGPARSAIVASSADELAHKLESAPIASASVPAPRIAFVYSGVGSQYAGMARELMATEPVFRAALERCDVEIEKLTGRSVREDLWASDPRVLARCERYQPMIFAVQVALDALLQAHGIVPDAVVGHSIGEVAAAHRAGILSLPDAAAVICHTARLLGRVEGDGAMLLLGKDASETEQLLRAEHARAGLPHGSIHGAVIAAENGARSTVVSGPRELIAKLAQDARTRGVFAHGVQTEVAYHHPMTHGALAVLPAALATLDPQPARIAMWSATDQRWLAGEECDARYWQRNQAGRVRFAGAIDALAALGPCSIVEISPHPLLLRELREGFGARATTPALVACMGRDTHGRRALLDALAALFRAGHALRSPGEAAQLARALPGTARRCLPLAHGVQLEVEDPAPVTLPLAAHSASALAAMAASLSERLGQNAELPLTDVLHKLARTRVALPHRATITASTRHGLRDALDALSRGDHARGLVTADPALRSARRAGGRLAFVFSGHGSQWRGMCRELLRGEPAFAEAIDACDAAFALCSAPRVRPVLEAKAPWPERADRVQPLLFATQVALARVWLAWGVTPDVVIGHSVGEIAAAHIAGALDLPSAARVVTERAAALGPAIGQGAMALVELPLDEAEALVAPYGERIAVAVHHGPACCVLAGEREALAEVLQVLDARLVFCRWVDVDYASHGAQMQPIARDLHARLQLVPLSAVPGPRLPMFSTALGRALEATTPLDAEYWACNLAQPVLFREAIEALVDADVTRFVEISSHPLLANGIAETARARGREVAFVPSLRRNAPERQTLAEALGLLFVAGHAVDFTRQHRDGDRSVALPPYPFERRKHWIARAGAVRASCACTPAAEPQAATACEPARAEAGLRDRLRAMDQAECLPVLRGLVRGEMARLLRMESARIEPEASFKDLGLDSLLGLELRSRLESATGIALSSTSMWATPSLEGVTRQLMEVGRRSM